MVISKKNCLILMASLAVLVGGCRVGPKYHPPCFPVPEKWKADYPPVYRQDHYTLWWKVFHDDILNDLECKALAYNRTLYTAIQKVIEARALAGVTRADLFPQANLKPSYSNMDTLFQIAFPSAIGISIPPAASTFRFHQTQYVLPLNLSYELDLWGKIRGQYDSALANAEAQYDALQVVLLTLTSDLASDYFLLRSIDAQLVLLEEEVRLYEKGVKVARDRYEKGFTSTIELAQITNVYTNVEAEYYDLLRQRVVQENAIAVLIGALPSEFHLEKQPLNNPPPAIPAGLPSDIMRRRPDIAEAERTRAAQHALIGVAYASYFPSMSLTGEFGFLSPNLKDFLTWKSRLWEFGTNIGQVVFDGGRISSNVDAAWARFREADGDYQEQVLVAFKEVENALSDVEYSAKQSISADRSAEEAEKVAKITQIRFGNGLGTYIDIVNTKGPALDSDRSAKNTLGLRYIYTIQLIKALGGGWQCLEVVPSVPVVPSST